MTPVTFSFNYPWKVHKMMTGNYLGVKSASCLLCQLPTRKKYLPTLTQSCPCFSEWHSRPKVRLNVVLCKFKHPTSSLGIKWKPALTGPRGVSVGLNAIICTKSLLLLGERLQRSARFTWWLILGGIRLWAAPWMQSSLCFHVCVMKVKS